MIIAAISLNGGETSRSYILLQYYEVVPSGMRYDYLLTLVLQGAGDPCNCAVLLLIAARPKHLSLNASHPSIHLAIFP